VTGLVLGKGGCVLLELEVPEEFGDARVLARLVRAWTCWDQLSTAWRSGCPVQRAWQLSLSRFRLQCNMLCPCLSLSTLLRRNRRHPGLE
jgi:hypothetical protein